MSDVPYTETASCFIHGDFDARYFRCPMCAAEREVDAFDTETAQQSTPRPSPGEAAEASDG